jgi:hypothetical protein
MVNKEAKLRQKIPNRVSAQRLALADKSFRLLFVSADSKVEHSSGGFFLGCTICTGVVNPHGQTRGGGQDAALRIPAKTRVLCSAGDAHEDLHLLGWYWREVYHYAPLIVAQVVFVYVFDMLLCWVRHDKWTLGFGPSLSF